jgi:hypothetical protein
MKFYFLICIAILIIPNAASIGVRPHETIIDFLPNLEYNSSFKIVNDENTTREIKLSVLGSFPEMIKLKENSIMQKPENELDLVHFSITLPETMDEGIHQSSIRINPQDEKSTGLGLALVMNHAVIIKVAPEYSRLLFDFSYEGQKIRMRLKNPRNEFIEDLKITLVILDKENSIESIHFQPMKMAPLEIKEIEQKNIKLKPGIYNVNYDVKSKKFNFSNIKEFIIGKKEISLIPKIDNLLANKINRIPASIENIWNEKTKVVIQMGILNGTSLLKDFRTQEMSFSPYEKRNIDLYLESQNIPPGNYTLRFLISYDKEKIKTERQIELLGQIKQSQKIEIVPMILGILIVIILVMLLLYLKRRKE